MDLQVLLTNVSIIYNRLVLINNLNHSIKTDKPQITIMKLNGKFSDYFRKKPVGIVGKLAIVNVGFNGNNPAIGGSGINGAFASKLNTNPINQIINKYITKSCVGDCYICEWNDQNIINKIGDIMLYIRGPVGGSATFDDDIKLLCNNMASLIAEYNKDKLDNDKITVLRTSSIGTGVAAGGDLAHNFQIYMRYILSYFQDIGLVNIELSSIYDLTVGWDMFDLMNELKKFSDTVHGDNLQLLGIGDIVINDYNILEIPMVEGRWMTYDLNDMFVKKLVVKWENSELWAGLVGDDGKCV